MKVSDLKGSDLDHWVGKLEGVSGPYSTDWSLSGPLIAREQINWVSHDRDKCVARHGYRGLGPFGFSAEGDENPQLASAMRCYLVAKVGEDIGTEH